MATFLLEIITPEKIVFQDEVDMVTVPAAEGILGILPNHADLYTHLTQGELKIKHGGKETLLSLFLRLKQFKQQGRIGAD